MTICNWRLLWGVGAHAHAPPALARANNGAVERTNAEPNSQPHATADAAPHAAPDGRAYGRAHDSAHGCAERTCPPGTCCCSH